MDNKRLGILLLIIGILIASSIFGVKTKEDQIINKVIEEEGTCFLEDGTCLHFDRNLTMYFAGWTLSAVIIALGIYLSVFEKSQKEIISTLEKHKTIQVNEEKFDILLKGLDADEKKVMKAVKEQDGITQQTLRLRTDLHKSKLSIVLDGLQKKDLIKKEPKGKTNQIFLKIGL
ncbi:helix-turn-helix transcriptional regulator [Nanoarchaeota archaeon]